MLAIVLVLTVFDVMSVPVFLSAALAILLVLVEMGTPRYVRPSWITGLRWFALIGLAVFGLYVGVRMVGMIPPGAL